jgi:hypothetical protein
VHALGSDAGPRAADDVAERIRALLGTGGVTGRSAAALRAGPRHTPRRVAACGPGGAPATRAATPDRATGAIRHVRRRRRPGRAVRRAAPARALAAGLAARHRSAEDLRALRRLLDELRAAHEEPETVARVDAALHRALAVAGRNAVLLHLLDDLAELSALSRRVTSPDADTRTRASHDLAAVVEAVEAQDEAAAEAAMRRHLDAVRAAVSGPDRPVA